MSDEPKPEDEVQEVEQETTAEAKPGKKAKVAKKKAAEPQAEGSAAPAEAPAAAAESTPVPEASPPAETPPAEPVATPEPAAISVGSAQPGRSTELFEQGVQALLRAEYDAADNFFGQALTNSRKNGDKAGQIAALEQLGHLCYLRSAIPQAREYYQQASLLRGA